MAFLGRLRGIWVRLVGLFFPRGFDATTDVQRHREEAWIVDAEGVLGLKGEKKSSRK